MRKETLTALPSDSSANRSLGLSGRGGSDGTWGSGLTMHEMMGGTTDSRHVPLVDSSVTHARVCVTPPRRTVALAIKIRDDTVFSKREFEVAGQRGDDALLG
ncbi:hypothetical protein GCM10009845_38760 [Pedococcus bigeumensis]